ncbi:MAG: hypothetical protein AB7I41_22360, partial [Candidatus Sericytochromatia bacterium]
FVQNSCVKVITCIALFFKGLLQKRGRRKGFELRRIDNQHDLRLIGAQMKDQSLLLLVFRG